MLNVFDSLKRSNSLESVVSESDYTGCSDRFDSLLTSFRSRSTLVVSCYKFNSGVTEALHALFRKLWLCFSTVSTYSFLVQKACVRPLTEPNATGSVIGLGLY